MIRLPHLRHTLFVAALVLPAMVACTDAPSAPVPATPRQQSAAARADEPLAVVTWQQKAGQLIVSHNFSPLAAGHAYALLGVAQYAGVANADFGGGQAQFEIRRGAIAGASVQVLSALFPDAAASLEQMVIDDGIAGRQKAHPQYTRGVAIGRAMGDVMKAWGASDGFSKPWDRVPLPTGPGLWRQAPGVPPAGFQFPTMRPYFLESPSQFRSVTPPAFGSPAFTSALQFVKQTTANRTQAQADIANFWNRPTTPGYWVGRAADLAVARGLDEREAAHLLGLMTAAILDASIGCFDAKYHYQYIRPTQADPTITLPLGTPTVPYTLPNHPSYPSGHSCLSGTAVTVLSAWFPEAADALHAEMVEAGNSRIYGGLHYQFDVAAGQELGRAVALNAIAYDQAHGLLTRVLPAEATP